MLVRPPNAQAEGTAASSIGHGARGRGSGGGGADGSEEGGDVELPSTGGTTRGRGRGRGAAAGMAPAVGTQDQAERSPGEKEQEGGCSGGASSSGGGSSGSGSEGSALAVAWAELSSKLWQASLPCCTLAPSLAFFAMGLARVLQDPTLWPTALHGPPQGGSSSSSATMFTAGTHMWTTSLVARFAGGLLVGHVGDTRGRRHALLCAMLITGLATLAMACMPNYTTHTHTWLFLLALQGVGVGGAWVGGVVVPYELCLCDRDRCLASSLPYAAGPLGLAAGASAMGLCFQGLGGREGAWVGNAKGQSWRFLLLAAAGGAVSSGVWVFRNGKEAPVFVELRQRQSTASLPIAKVLCSRPLSLGCGLLIMAFVALTQNLVLRGWHVLLGLPPSVHWMAATLALLSPFILLGAYVATRFPNLGRRGVYGLMSALVGLGCLPWLHMPTASEDPNMHKLPTHLHRQWQRAALQACTLGPVLGLLQGPMASLLADLFDTSTLTTGTATAYHGAFLLTSLLYPHLLLPSLHANGQDSGKEEDKPPPSLPMLVLGVALISALSACATRWLQLSAQPTQLTRTRSLLLRECLGWPLHHSIHSDSSLQASPSPPPSPSPSELQMGPWWEDLGVVAEEQSHDLQSTAAPTPPHPPAAQPPLAAASPLHPPPHSHTEIPPMPPPMPISRHHPHYIASRRSRRNSHL